MNELLDFHAWETLFRTTVAFIVLLILARFMGKKQISQLSFFHYVTGITIGSIAAEIAAQQETAFVDGVIAMIWWALLTLLMSYIALKSKKARVILDDQPTIIMYEGRLVEEAMRKSRLHLSDLNMMLREQGIFSIKEVQYAIFETNGNLSVLKKADQEPATKKDVHAPAPEPKYLPSEIIADGKIVKKNLTELHLTEEWVYDQLKKQGIGKVDQVFYAEIQTDGSLHVHEKSDNHK
ncbi:DUF421 domain-containing protein [Sporosarcina sp. NPDC096371]|uniref:DUF421 domain-containing protein n=1 Tax=Sporosarcina sp. NPDC096371 TaxID=3364530 RepID=UPI00382088E9